VVVRLAVLGVTILWSEAITLGANIVVVKALVFGVAILWSEAVTTGAKVLIDNEAVLGVILVSVVTFSANLVVTTLNVAGVTI